MKKILSPRFLSTWLLYTVLFTLGKWMLDGALDGSVPISGNDILIGLGIGLILTLLFQRFFNRKPR